MIGRPLLSRSLFTFSSDSSVFALNASNFQWKQIFDWGSRKQSASTTRYSCIVFGNRFELILYFLRAFLSSALRIDSNARDSSLAVFFLTTHRFLSPVQAMWSDALDWTKFARSIEISFLQKKKSEDCFIEEGVFFPFATDHHRKEMNNIVYSTKLVQTIFWRLIKKSNNFSLLRVCRAPNTQSLIDRIFFVVLCKKREFPLQWKGWMDQRTSRCVLVSCSTFTDQAGS